MCLHRVNRFNSLPSPGAQARGSGSPFPVVLTTGHFLIHVRDHGRLAPLILSLPAARLMAAAQVLSPSDADGAPRRAGRADPHGSGAL